MSTDDRTARQDDSMVATETDENGRSTDAAEPERVDSEDESNLVSLFDRGDADEFRGRWNDIQAGFVDHPRQVVEQADELVAELMKRMSAQFAEERSRLEGQWDSDEDVSTEELRVALTRYRSFFERLLAV